MQIDVPAGFDLRLHSGFHQTISVLESTETYKEVSYIGVDPILVRDRKTQRVLFQSGFAVGHGVRFKPPAQVLPDAPLLDTPVVTVTPFGFRRWKTEWTYALAIEDTQFIDYAAWQAVPSVIETF